MDVDVHVFAEPGTFTVAVPLPNNPLVVHQNAATLGCFGNWRHAVECLLATTTAEWLLVVQDDAIWAPGSAHVLIAEIHKRQDQRTGFLSPYVTDKDVTEEFTDGWNECHSGWQFYGALTFCVERAAAAELLHHPRFANHTSKKQVDAVVAASMIDLGRPSFVHVPSLVDHVGTTSTIENNSAHLRGYRFRQKGSS